MSHITRSLRRKGALVGLSAAALFAGITSIAPAANAMSANVAGTPVNVDTSAVMNTVAGLPSIDVPGVGTVDAASLMNNAVSTVNGIANTGITL